VYFACRVSSGKNERRGGRRWARPRKVPGGAPGVRAPVAAGKRRHEAGVGAAREPAAAQQQPQQRQLLGRRGRRAEQRPGQGHSQEQKELRHLGPVPDAHHLAAEKKLQVRYIFIESLCI